MLYDFSGTVRITLTRTRHAPTASPRLTQHEREQRLHSHTYVYSDSHLLAYIDSYSHAPVSPGSVSRDFQTRAMGTRASLASQSLIPAPHTQCMCEPMGALDVHADKDGCTHALCEPPCGLWLMPRERGASSAHWQVVCRHPCTRTYM